MSSPVTAEGTPSSTQDLSLEEISARYAGRWVAITVTARDEDLQPRRGIVVADEIDRYKLRTRLSGYQDICILFAGDSPYHMMF